MSSRFRLTSNAFIRSDDVNKIPTRKMFVLSVEGNTERDYFMCLNEHLDRSIMQIEVLGHTRRDGHSDPSQVIDLLNEYLDLREGKYIPDELRSELKAKYSEEAIRLYLDDPDALSEDEKRSIADEIFNKGLRIDIDYLRYLKTFDKEKDYYAVVIDRDCGNHSRELMEECHKACDNRGADYYVTNPCFEFWLLLHLKDVKSEYTEEDLQRFLENPKVSAHHTAVSKEVSTIAHHGKSITGFDTRYYPHISEAVTHVKDFAITFPELYDNLGSNLHDFISMLSFENQ